MDDAKLRFSEEEIRLLKNRDWILTKNEIIRKVSHFFGALATQAESAIPKTGPGFLLENRPKVSKGEQYQGLPYVMLDYPREFSRDNIFAIRTMFWWGHYFSVCLHLKGTYKEIWSENVIEKADMLAREGFYLCICGDEWSHDLLAKEYKPVSEIHREDLIRTVNAMPFCKLGAVVQLDSWALMADRLMSKTETLMLISGMH